MTRRIVAAILLAVWTTLIAGGAAAYVAVRSVMLEELDDAIAARAAALAQPGEQSATQHPRDRFIIVDERGNTVARMPVDAPALRPARVVDRAFSTLGDGRRMRTVTLKMSMPPATAGGDERQVSIVYSAPADAFDRSLNRLAWTLFIGGVAAGLLAAAVARAIAARALRPLHDATAILRGIDVHSLDRRLDPEPLPPELRPVATTLNDMLAALQLAVDQRRQFLADASHELRTPIAALLTAMEISLSRPRSEGELRRTLERCLGNVGALRQLVEHLLDQVRSDRFGDEAPPGEVRVSDCIDQVRALHEAAARGRDIRIEVACDRSLRVLTQPRRLHSIVSNLLSNAIEHNRPGGSARVVAEAIGDGLAVTVSDDGPGIAPEHQGRVFEPFYRVSAARESANGHTGLGLFLVHTHVNALGGRYELTSKPGEGTTIRVELPRCVSVPSPPEAEVAVPQTATG